MAGEQELRARCPLCELPTPKRCGHGCVRCVGRLEWSGSLARPGGVRSNLRDEDAEAWCLDRYGQGYPLRHRSYVGRDGDPTVNVDVEIVHNAVSRRHMQIRRDAFGDWELQAFASAKVELDGVRLEQGQSEALLDGGVIRVGDVLELRFHGRARLPESVPIVVDMETHAPPTRFEVRSGNIKLDVQRVSESERYAVRRDGRELLVPPRLGPLLRELLAARARGDTTPLDREAVARSSRMTRKYLAVCKRDLRVLFKILDLGENELIEKQELRLAVRWLVRAV